MISIHALGAGSSSFHWRLTICDCRFAICRERIIMYSGTAAQNMSLRGVLRRVEHVVEVMERGLTDMDGVACSYSSLES